MKAIFRISAFLVSLLFGAQNFIFAQNASLWQNDLNEISFKIYQQKTTQFYQEGKFEEAVKAAESALRFARESFPAGSPLVGAALTDLAWLRQAVGREDQAVSLHRKALKIWSQDPKYFEEASGSFDSLGLLMQARGKYRQAESFFKRAWKLRQKYLGAEDPGVGICLNNLAGLYRLQEKYDLSEKYYERALAIWEKALPPFHPNIAKGLNNLAVLYQSRGELDRALPLFEKAMNLRRNIYGSGHPQVAVSLYNLAGIYWAEGRYGEAEAFYRQALEIWQNSLEPGHAYIENTLQNLELLSQAQTKYEKGRAAPK